MDIHMMKLYLKRFYHHTWSWIDGTTLFYLNTESDADRIGSMYKTSSFGMCGQLNKVKIVQGLQCWDIVLFGASEHSAVCERLKKPVDDNRKDTQPVSLSPNPSSLWPEHSDVTSCSDSHWTRTFLVGSTSSRCDNPSVDQHQHMKRKSVVNTSNTTQYFSIEEFELYRCVYSDHVIPFSFVCDTIAHCPGESDENWCVYRPCPASSFRCNDKQCVDEDRQYRQDCFLMEDETRKGNSVYQTVYLANPPSIVHFTGSFFLQVQS